MNDGQPAGALIVAHSDDLQSHTTSVNTEVEQMVSVEHGELARGSHRYGNPECPDLMFAPVARQSDLYAYSVARIRCVVTRSRTYLASKGTYVTIYRD